jgi:hypothetical protein
MKSRPVGTNQNIYATQANDRHDDARGGSFLLAHQQLGALSLATNPTNGQTVTFDVNGTNIVATFVTAIGSAANNILIGVTAAASVQNLLNWLRRPDLTNSNQIAASLGNQTLLSYVGWAWPGSSTTIVPFSLNKNVNGITGALTTFTITTTVTSGSWTAQTMQLYVEDGVYYIGSTQVKFLGSSTPTVTAPSSHPRIDVLTIDTSGTLAWTTGTEASSPSVPAYPSGKIPICELYNVVSETALYDTENQQSGEGYISNDVRPYTSVLAGGYNPVANGVGSASSTTNQTIAHGLSRIPVSLEIVATLITNSNLYANSAGFYNGTTMSCIQLSNGTNSAYIVDIADGSGHSAIATVTWDATNIYLSWTFSGSPGTVDYIWKIM